MTSCSDLAASSTVSSSPVLEARREKAGHECEARARVDGKALPFPSFLARSASLNRGGATGDEAGDLEFFGRFYIRLHDNKTLWLLALLD